MTCGVACADMAMACGGSNCGGSTVNLCTDSNNCGACNHSCGAGACVASVCQGTAIITAQMSPWGVAVDANNVYWTDLNTASTDGTVMSRPKGGGSATPLASMQWAPHDLVLNANGLYWENYSAGEIWRIAPLGSAKVNVATEPSQMIVFAVDATNAYFVEKGSTIVHKAALAGGAASTPLTMVTAGLAPGNLAADGTYVYWVNVLDGSIKRTTTDGVTTTTLVPSAGADVLYAFGGDVYFSTKSDIQKVNGASGGTPMVVVSGIANGLTAMVVDTDGVYFTNNTAGTVQRAGSDGVAHTIGASQVHPIGIATDATAIYWAEAGTGANDGQIMMAVK
jgi:hypothetical protein